MTAADRTAIASTWHLFGLRIRSEHLVLRLPADTDLEDLMGQQARRCVLPARQGVGLLAAADAHDLVARLARGAWGWDLPRGAMRRQDPAPR